MSTRAEVDIEVLNNATWEDAFKFGKTSDTTWDFASKTFHLDIKAAAADVAVVLALTSGAGEIVVDDTVLRVLHFNVVDTNLPPIGEYVYDLVMLDNSTPPVRTVLMGGEFEVKQGVTQS